MVCSEDGFLFSVHFAIFCLLVLSKLVGGQEEGLRREAREAIKDENAARRCDMVTGAVGATPTMGSSSLAAKHDAQETGPEVVLSL